MIRIKVISFREIIYRIILMIIIVVVIYISAVVCVRLSSKIDRSIEKKIINSTLPVYEGNNIRTSDINFLKSELNMFGEIDIDDEAEEKEQKISDESFPISTTHELYAEKLSGSKYKIGSVYVNSYLDNDINLEELSKPLLIKASMPCKILLYHTHTSESYTLDSANHTDYYRTENNDYNVVSVGKKLAENLENYGFKVTQDTTCHDYPSYNGAYKASLRTVEKYLEKEQYDIILDIHRDALSGNSSFRPTVQINGETAAKLMIVVGTNAAGLEHNDWMQNFKFAIALQQKANEMYPGLFRDIHLSTSRYNQHTSDRTLIIEVGATGNTIEETEIAMKYFAEILQKLVYTE